MQNLEGPISNFDVSCIEVGESSRFTHTDSHMIHKGLRGRGRGKHIGKVRKPRGWIPPEVVVDRTSPIRLRSTTQGRPATVFSPRQGQFSRSPSNSPESTGHRHSQVRLLVGGGESPIGYTRSIGSIGLSPLALARGSPLKLGL